MLKFKDENNIRVISAQKKHTLEVVENYRTVPFELALGAFLLRFLSPQERENEGTFPIAAIVYETKLMFCKREVIAKSPDTLPQITPEIFIITL